MKYIQLYEEVECNCAELNYGEFDPDCKICYGEGYIRKKAGQISIKELKKLLEKT